MNKAIDLKFNFENNNLVVLGTFENPLFLVKNVCTMLGIAHTSCAIENIPPKYIQTVKYNYGRGLRDTKALTEAGLYFLIMRSTKAPAEKFREWIADEILPSLRTTGMYKMSQEYIDTIEELKVKHAKQVKFMTGEIRDLTCKVYLTKANESYYF
jgi:prophage antirepressor-like protein